MGKHEKALAQQSIRLRQPLPDRIANAPELEPGLQFYLVAFFDLDTERSHSIGLTPIPWSSIVRYAAYYDLDEEYSERLLFFIRKLDNYNLERLDAKQKAKPKK